MSGAAVNVRSWAEERALLVVLLFVLLRVVDGVDFLGCVSFELRRRSGESKEEEQL